LLDLPQQKKTDIIFDTMNEPDAAETNILIQICWLKLQPKLATPKPKILATSLLPFDRQPVCKNNCVVIGVTQFHSLEVFAND